MFFSLFWQRVRAHWQGWHYVLLSVSAERRNQERARCSVFLATPKILSFGIEKKNKFSFCISLTYPYLCKIIYFG